MHYTELDGNDSAEVWEVYLSMRCAPGTCMQYTEPVHATYKLTS